MVVVVVVDDGGRIHPYPKGKRLLSKVKALIMPQTLPPWEERLVVMVVMEGWGGGLMAEGGSSARDSSSVRLLLQETLAARDLDNRTRQPTRLV